MIRIFLAALVAALLCVFWGAFSWGAIPGMSLKWHQATLRKFSDEKTVATAAKSASADVLESRKEKSGVFMLPGPVSAADRMPQDQAMVKNQLAQTAREAGPFIYAIIRPGTQVSSMSVNLGFAYGRSFISCFVIALLLSCTVRLDYIQRVFVCVLAGLFAGTVADLPMFIWFEFPLRYTLINMADHLCEWFIAGLALAAFVEGREVWEKLR